MRKMLLIWVLLVTTLAMWCFPKEGSAMLVPAMSTGTELISGANRAADLQKIQRVLEAKIVQQRLEDFGLTPDEVNARLNRLSDAQLHQLATQIDDLVPGGELGLVIGLLVVAILVVILILLLSHKIVVTK
jgi:hypothetical protein